MAPRRLLVLIVTALLALMLAIPASGASRNQAAAPMARYYASFGPTQPIARPAATEAALPDPDSGPGWTLTIVAGVALLAAGTLAGRVSIRPRHPAL